MEKNKRNKEPQETELFEHFQETESEIEVRACSYMILNPENLRKPFIRSDVNNPIKIDAGEILHKSKENVVCRITKKPCVLYASGREGVLPYINYHHLERCPSSEDSVKKYGLKGTQRGVLFYPSKISRIKEKK